MFKKLKKLFKVQHDAHDAIEREINKLYPIGSLIRFTRGRAIVTAKVLGTQSWRAEYHLRVYNIQTLKEYWVSISSHDPPEVVIP